MSSNESELKDGINLLSKEIPIDEPQGGLNGVIRLAGSIVHGDKLGRILGYPTANIAVETGSPSVIDGVYAGWLVLDDQYMPAAISLGINSTFDAIERRLEAHVLDRTDLSIYGRKVTVILGTHIRGMRKFPDVATLVARIEEDVCLARTWLQRNVHLSGQGSS
ncbi:riboflavin kinase [Streptomyces sp. NPDC056069]|uniref:riboflavin kinase n=1 Tax=Streptomyces sp. NPDC056069 TaxID=3345702 RepID=UPI0035E07D7E